MYFVQLASFINHSIDEFDIDHVQYRVWLVIASRKMRRTNISRIKYVDMKRDSPLMIGILASFISLLILSSDMVK